MWKVTDVMVDSTHARHCLLGAILECLLQMLECLLQVLDGPAKCMPLHGHSYACKYYVSVPSPCNCAAGHIQYSNTMSPLRAVALGCLRIMMVPQQSPALDLT